MSSLKSWLCRGIRYYVVVLASVTLYAAPCPNYVEHKQPFFGDLHVHTKYSLDAATQETRTTPEEAYRFAKGEPIGIAPWRNGVAQRTVQLDRPLDFAMVADHAELLGEVALCSDPSSSHYHAWQCSLYRGWPRGAYYWFNLWSSIFAARVGFCGDESLASGDDSFEPCTRAARGPWQAIQRAAAAHNDSESCEFTTFVGYEWTGGSVNGEYGNIHRNVVFRDHHVPELPIDFIQANTSDTLFDQLDAQCVRGGLASLGCDALVIPHNSNLSAGLMFGLKGSQSDSPKRLEQRARYEVLAEIMQHKGSSECFFDRSNPLGNPDEYCEFEQLSQRSFTDSGPPKIGDGYLRSVLTQGLGVERQTGVNPHRFGFIGSTDTHLGTPGLVAEDGFPGHGGAGKPPGDPTTDLSTSAGLPDLLDYNPGGLAVLWATENRRAALFDAMRRREAYATSGPRMVVRLFAGPELPDGLCEADDFAPQGYRLGVPMGGLLETAQHGTGAGMRIAMQAHQDSNSVGLERLQVIKGWVDAEGRGQEKVFDIARSPVVHELDSTTCEVRGASAARLCGVWQDPEFDPDETAYYYGRVLEGPSCRWSQRQCVAAGVNCDQAQTMTAGYESCCQAAHKPTIRERAWTSPVWFNPALK